MYATDRRQRSDVRRASSLNAPYSRGGGITKRLKSIGHSILTLLSGKLIMVTMTDIGAREPECSVFAYKNSVA